MGSWIWPNAGWNLSVGGSGDINSNPASTASGAIVKRTGMYWVTGSNIVEGCAPNYYWIYQGYGLQPFNWSYHDVSTTPTNGKCFVNVTIGNQLRQPIVGAPKPPLPPAANTYLFVGA